jgi:DNA-binding HxlR family transcriptional regulator
MQVVLQSDQTTMDDKADSRSSCPINLALEVVGDRWSLLIVRDLMFAGKRHFRELLQSEEGISSNILAERLKRLVDAGVLSKTEDPTHKQKAIYRLTPMGIDLLPVVAHLGIWGQRHLPVTRQSAANAAQLEKGGPALLRKLAAKLRQEHLA